MSVFLRFSLLAALVALLVSGLSAATLEKLTVEEMAQKATLVVRGRVTGCAGEATGSVIYTRCTAAVTETWKGSGSGTVRFGIPGGRARGLIQTFIGTPKFNEGEEYVLFLWAGRSGNNQIIGLSQGVFDVKANATTGKSTVRREASAERMLDKSGSEVADTAAEYSVSELRSRVQRALEAAQ